jgi:hypothetical protein
MDRDYFRLTWVIVQSLSRGNLMSEGVSVCIAPQITVLDIVSRYRETEAIFKRWNDRADACICCEALFDTLRQVTSRYGLDLDRLLTELNAAADQATINPS